MFHILIGSLRARLVWLVLLSLLPGFGLILYMASENQRQGIVRVEENALQLARIAAGGQERLIEGVRQILNALSLAPPIRDADAAACSGLLPRFLEKLPFCTNLAIIAPDGKVLCSAAPSAGELNFADRAYFQRAIQTRDFVVSGYQNDPMTGKGAIVLALPVLDAAGGVRSVVTAVMDLERLNRLTLEARLPEGSTLTVADRRGTVLAWYPASGAREGIPPQDTPLTQTDLTREEGTLEAQGADGAVRIYAFARLKGLGKEAIYVKIGIPRDAALGEVRRIRARSLAWLALATILALTATWWYGEFFILRLVRALTSAARRLEAGESAARSDLPAGEGELDRLARAFDAMAESLERRESELRESEARYRILVEQMPALTYIAALDDVSTTLYISPQVESMLGYSQAEYLALPDLWCESLHREDRERVLAKAAEARSGERPFACEYRMHARDGRVLWARDEAVMVRDDSGRPVFLQGVMVDITERKQVEDTLRLNESRLEALVELARMKDAPLEEITRFTLEEGVRLTQSEIGYLAFVDEEEKVLTMHSWSRTAMKKCLIENKPITYPLETTGLWGESVRQRRHIITNDYLAPDSLKKGCPPGHVALLRHMGVPVFDGDRIVAVAGVGNKGEPYDDSDARQLTLLVDAMWRSVREKEADDTVRRLNRALKILNDCNQALVRATSESDLLERICEIVVAEGGYRLAWVSVAEQGPDQKVRVAAHAGFESDRLVDIDLTRAETDRGMGPTEKAIRTGKPCIVKDIRTDPDYAPRRAGALDLGCRSSVAFPLSGDERPFGALTIMAGESDAFNEEEVRVLMELADDLAYGVTSLRAREQRRRAEEALREREHYFGSILYSLHEDIIVIDRDHRVTDANRSFLFSVGKKREEVVGRRCHELLHGLDSPCVAGEGGCGLESVFETGKPCNHRHEHLGPDRSRYWADILFSPLRNEDGRVTQVIEAIRDVTGEVQLREQLRQSQKMEAIGTLAGGIAHDFNNILGIILGYIELAFLDVPKETMPARSLEQALKAVDRARDLVKQILAFSRRSDHERKPMGFSHLLTESLSLLRAALPSTIEIHKRIETSPDGGDIILADPTQIHQVIMNLAGNAGHAMREKGGVLEVRLSNFEVEPGEAARMRGLAPGSYVALAVSDTGEGMPLAVLDRIFEPYFTTKSASEGTGLGLAVVHGIVTSHGGAVTVSSELGAGTTFRVFLPKLASGPKRSEPEDAPVPVGAERILFVDDESALADVGRRMLTRLGYKVQSKTNSIEALEEFRARPDQFDLIVTDHTMPGMTGVELARQVMLIRPDMPLVLCTGFSENVSPEKAATLGFRGFVMKPLSRKDLAATVRRVLDEARTS